MNWCMRLIVITVINQKISYEAHRRWLIDMGKSFDLVMTQFKMSDEGPEDDHHY
jgi:hypothetical protein